MAMKTSIADILAIIMINFIPTSSPTSYHGLDMIFVKFMILRTTSPQPIMTFDKLIPAGPTASRAPTIMTEEIALVTLINGECRAGVTFHTT